MILRRTVAAIFMALVFGFSDHQSFADVVTIGASQDNSMFEASQTNSNGAGSYFFAGRTGINNGSLLQRGLLAFDLTTAGITAGATIDSASLVLHMSKSPFNQTHNIGLHVANQAWGEAGSNSDGFFPGEGAGDTAQLGDATWQHTFFPGSTWTSLGGDFTSTASASQTVGFVPGFFTWSSATMAADLQNWLGNPGSNFGWVVLGDESGPTQTAKRFDSRENSNVAFRPMLTINWTPNAIPEPSSGAICALFVGIGFLVRRRNRAVG